MELKSKSPVSAEGRAFVSYAEAAAIACRSYTWVRNRAVDGRLEARRLSAGGPLLVPVTSLLSLIEESCSVEPIPSRKRCRPH
ncbi:hypothetical protein DBT53_002695, partial [Aerococcus mictus]|uniref:hypothetical protein n=1 Tax=Aerococcus mictus TaxID=2976810 RepID=UPI002FD1100B